MPLGPGKYDGIAEAARARAKAVGAVVIVLDGEHGSGFEVNGPLELNLRLPELLEEVAANIRKSFQEGKL